jgi:hypothetical protein
MFGNLLERISAAAGAPGIKSETSCVSPPGSRKALKQALSSRQFADKSKAVAKSENNQSLVYLSPALCRVAKDSLTHKRYLPLEKDFANKLRMLFTSAQRLWRGCQRSTRQMFLMPVALSKRRLAARA